MFGDESNSMLGMFSSLWSVAAFLTEANTLAIGRASGASCDSTSRTVKNIEEACWARHKRIGKMLQYNTSWILTFCSELSILFLYSSSIPSYTFMARNINQFSSSVFAGLLTLSSIGNCLVGLFCFIGLVCLLDLGSGSWTTIVSIKPNCCNLKFAPRGPLHTEFPKL